MASLLALERFFMLARFGKANLQYRIMANLLSPDAKAHRGLCGSERKPGFGPALVAERALLTYPRQFLHRAYQTRRCHATVRLGKKGI